MKARVAAILIVVLAFVGSTASASAEPKEGERQMIEKLVELTQSVQEYVVRVRRYLHHNPETRWEEEGTIHYIWREIDEEFSDRVPLLRSAGDFQGGLG